MHKPIWSWTDTLTRLGFTRRKKPQSFGRPHCRRLQIEPLEQRHLLSVDLAAVAFYSDGDHLTVRYNVAEEDVRPFDIGIYSSSDKVTPGTLLETWRINGPDARAVGMHEATKALDLSGVPADHFLIAVVDLEDKVAEPVEWNNQLAFQGGIIDTPQGRAHVATPPGQGNAGFDPAQAPLWTLGGYWAEQAAGRGQGGTLPGVESLGGPAGQLDPEFDGDSEGNGIVITDLATSWLNGAAGVAVQDDGKIVVAGFGLTSPGFTFDFLVLRYNDNGTLDNSFGSGGVATVDFDNGQYSGNDYAMDVAIDSNGKIVVAGYGTDASGTYDYLALARLDTFGVLDQGFSGDGKVRDQIPGGRPVWGWALAIDANDRIVVAGVAVGTGEDFLLVRYLANGDRDTSFGDPANQGIVRTDFFGYNDIAWGVTIDAEGKIVVVGESVTPGGVNMALARYNTDGSLDDGDNPNRDGLPDITPGDSFGTGGIRTFDFNAGNDAAYDVAIDSDGKIVVAGRAYVPGNDYDFALARLTAGGDLDATFGEQGSGKRTTHFGYGPDAAKGLAISRYGRITLGGSGYNGTNNDFALARYDSDGNLDLTFGTDGKVLTPMPANDDGNTAEDIVLDAENRIVAVGVAYAGSDYDIMLARYLGNPDIEITGFSVNPTDRTLLDVSYYIWHSDVAQFRVALFGMHDEYLSEPRPTWMSDHVLVDQTQTTVGPHTVSIPVDFERFPGAGGFYYGADLFLMAQVDSEAGAPFNTGVIVEESETNNTMVFEGGIFRDANSNFVHVHGTDTPYGDPQYDRRDVVRLEVDQDLLNYTVYLNDPADFEPAHPQPLSPYSAQTFTVEEELVRFDVRLHLGNDTLLTQVWYDEQEGQWKGVNVPVHAYGGDGDDSLAGGITSDQLFGDRGDDPELLGRAGADTISGGPGDDGIEGGEERDWIYGKGGDDRIEGGPGRDVIFGDHYWQSAGAGSSDDGDDIITGGPEPPPAGEYDRSADDEIAGGGGDDRIDGWYGNDLLYGDYHPFDVVHWPDPTAGAGNDEIYGWDGDDEIWGGPGDDTLFGEAGNNTIYGGDYSFVLGEEITYDGDQDWIYPPDPDDKYPRIDLVTAIDGALSPVLASWNNRQENGFFGDRFVGVSQSLEDGEVQMYLHDAASPSYNYGGKTLKLDWQRDGEVIEVYIFNDQTQEYERITPEEAVWEIPIGYEPPDPIEPFARVYVKAVGTAVGEDTGLILTLLDETGNPIDGWPLSDFVYIYVVA